MTEEGVRLLEQQLQERKFDLRGLIKSNGFLSPRGVFIKSPEEKSKLLSEISEKLGECGLLDMMNLSDCQLTDSEMRIVFGGIFQSFMRVRNHDLKDLSFGTVAINMSHNLCTFEGLVSVIRAVNIMSLAWVQGVVNSVTVDASYNPLSVNYNSAALPVLFKGLCEIKSLNLSYSGMDDAMNRDVLVALKGCGRAAMTLALTSYGDNNLVLDSFCLRRVNLTKESEMIDLVERATQKSDINSLLEMQFNESNAFVLSELLKSLGIFDDRGALIASNDERSKVLNAILSIFKSNQLPSIVDASNCSLSDEEAMILCRSIYEAANKTPHGVEVGSSNARSINLSGNNITSIFSVTQPLLFMTRIEGIGQFALDLSRNPLNDYSKSFKVSDVLLRKNSLTLLDLRGSGMTNDEKARILESVARREDDAPRLAIKFSSSPGDDNVKALARKLGDVISFDDDSDNAAHNTENLAHEDANELAGSNHDAIHDFA